MNLVRFENKNVRDLNVKKKKKEETFEWTKRDAASCLKTIILFRITGETGKEN